MAAPCELLEVLVDDSLLLHCAQQLSTATDLLHLALTCRRFALRTAVVCGTTRSHVVHGEPASRVAAPAVATAQPEPLQQSAEMWSIVEEVARRWLNNCSELERGWVPRRGGESWLSLMREVELLRGPVVFTRAHPSYSVAQCGTLVKLRVDNAGEHWRAAATGPVLRAGQHCAQFTVVDGDSMHFGVIRPDWDVVDGADSSGQDAAAVEGHCFYNSFTGFLLPGYRRWQNEAEADSVSQYANEGDCIGLVLDIDQGSMSVYKNDMRLGVMVASGLTGEYCWAVSLGSEQGDSARIGPMALPSKSHTLDGNSHDLNCCKA
eukprot:COSAG03_NODE_15_length_22165_cov_72.809934_20_plen_320_part_00